MKREREHMEVAGNKELRMLMCEQERHIDHICHVLCKVNSDTNSSLQDFHYEFLQ